MGDSKRHTATLGELASDCLKRHKVTVLIILKYIYTLWFLYQGKVENLDQEKKAWYYTIKIIFLENLEVF